MIDKSFLTYWFYTYPLHGHSVKMRISENSNLAVPVQSLIMINYNSCDMYETQGAQTLCSELFKPVQQFWTKWQAPKVVQKVKISKIDFPVLTTIHGLPVIGLVFQVRQKARAQKKEKRKEKKKKERKGEKREKSVA